MPPKKTYEGYADADLQQLLYQGDEDAFSHIYDRYWDKLLAIAYFHLRDQETAKEIVQDVFLSLWNRRLSVKLHTLENYLATATKYALYAFLLKEKRRKAILSRLRLREEIIFDVDEKINARFLAGHINDILDTLPSKCRLVFVKSRGLGLANEAIAEDPDISVKTVEAHITKALKTLRFSLKDHQLTILQLAALEQLLEIFKK